MDISINKEDLVRLSRFPENEKKVVQMTLQRAGMQVREQSDRNAPYKSGDLKSSITMQPQNVPIGADKVIVGSNKVYARIQDTGGVIKPKNKKLLAFKVNGQFVFARSVTIKGNKYMTNAYEQIKDDMGKIFNEEFEHYIIK